VSVWRLKHVSERYNGQGMSKLKITHKQNVCVFDKSIKYVKTRFIQQLRILIIKLRSFFFYVYHF